MQIENHVPPPFKPNWKADLDKMEINQSARINIKYYNSVKAAISQHFHGNPPADQTVTRKGFTTAKEPGGSFRVWRVR